MIQMNKKLEKLHEEGKSIKVGIIGAGQMGRGMTGQMMMMKGMRPVIMVDINPDLAIKAYRGAGISADDIKKTDSLSEANQWVAKG